MDVVVISQCQRELKEFPPDVLGEVLDCLARLRSGLVLSMPLSRPMPSVGKGIHELRLRDRGNQYRVVYVFTKGSAIYLVHAFSKKTQQTPQKNIETALIRIKQL